MHNLRITRKRGTEGTRLGQSGAGWVDGLGDRKAAREGARWRRRPSAARSSTSHGTPHLPALSPRLEHAAWETSRQSRPYTTRSRPSRRRSDRFTRRALACQRSNLSSHGADLARPFLPCFQIRQRHPSPRRKEKDVRTISACPLPCDRLGSLSARPTTSRELAPPLPSPSDPLSSTPTCAAALSLRACGHERNMMTFLSA